MRIAYLLEWEFDKIDGVIQKVLNQADIWRSFGHEVKIFALSNTKDTLKIEGVKNYHKSIKNLIYFNNLYKDLVAFNPNIVYFRYSSYKPYLNWVFKRFKSVLELNTNDLSEQELLKDVNFKKKFAYYNTLLTYKYMQSMVSGIVAVTNEIANSIFYKDKLIAVIPNSINLDSYKTKKRAEKKEVPNLVFIGSPNQNWHGIDKIISLAKASQDKLFFHIIGEDKPKDLELKNIKFYGYMKRDEYKEVLINSNIGIGTLALHRKNMQEACPLKVREYLAFGLPIIIGYKDTAISKKFDWVLELPNTEDNIEKNIQRVINFCYDKKSRIVNDIEVKDVIDSSYWERNRVDFLKRVLDGEV